MTCQSAEALLHALVDGELDSPQQHRLEAHLASCTACAQHLIDLQTLKGSLGADSLYYQAPETLFTRVKHTLATAPMPAWSGYLLNASRGYLALAASILLLVMAGSFFLAFQYFAPASHDTIIRVLADQAVARSIQSQSENQLVDLASGNAAQVTDWLKTKNVIMPLAPSQPGMPLRGARLDALNHRQVAVVVYGQGDQTIQVFFWHQHCREQPAVQEWNTHGYHARYWAATGRQFLVISRSSGDDVNQLVQAIQNEYSLSCTPSAELQ